jgi:outer membrane protein OmpA-like peptidoglycan-associated protein
MMKANKWILLLLITAVLGGAGFWWYRHTGTVKEDPPAPGSNTTASDLPIGFYWNNDEAILGSGFDSLRRSVLAEMATRDSLLIKTFYYENEPGGIALARRRAGNLKVLFSDVPAGKLVVEAAMLADTAKTKPGLLGAVNFYFKAATPKQMEQAADKITIYFPAGAAVKTIETPVEDYFAQLAASFAAERGRSITLTGYADSREGSADKTLQLSKERAAFVKARMVAKGVDGGRITIQYKGSNTPAANKKTAEDGDKNRRVEIFIF